MIFSFYIFFIVLIVFSDSESRLRIGFDLNAFGDNIIGERGNEKEKLPSTFPPFNYEFALDSSFKINAANTVWVDTLLIEKSSSLNNELLFKNTASEYCQLSNNWKISLSLTGNELCSKLTNLSDSLVDLRLSSDITPGAGSTIDVYVFDGNQWNRYETGNLFLNNRALRTTFSPNETKKFCCGISTNNKKLDGVVVVNYYLIYHIPPSTKKRLYRKDIILSAASSVNTVQVESEHIYWEVDKIPKFPGGEKALSSFFKNRINLSKKDKLFGILKVIIKKDGTVKYPCVIERNIFNFDEKILPLIKEMPKWIPAYRDGKPVRVIHTIIVNIENELLN